MRKLEPGRPVWPGLLALAALCLVGGGLTMWPLLEHLGLAIAALVLIASLMTWLATRSLSVKRSQLPDHAVVGETISVSYSLKSGLVPALRVVLENADGAEREIGQGLAERTGSEARATSGWPERGRGWSAFETGWLVREMRANLGPHGQESIHYHHIMSRRGRVEFGRARIFAEDPFGIFRLACAVFPARSMIVYPRPIPVPALALPTTATRSSHHRWRLSSADATIGDLRPYIAGDPPSRVHWKSTARTGTLMVTDPESHRPLTVWILADLGGEAPESERVPGIAAYLAQEMLDGGLTLGLIAAGTETTTVSAMRGLQQRPRILEVLACTPASRQTRVVQLLQAAARCESPGKIVLVTYGQPALEVVRGLRRLCPDVTIVRAGAEASPT